jgi:tRNA G10  N-methylase Trm11
MGLLAVYIEGYTSLKPSEKKEVLKDTLMLKNPIGGLFDILVDEISDKPIKRQAINLLCDIAQKPTYFKTIFRTFTPDYAGDILSCDDPKIRKAAARLCGIANQKKFNAPLIKAIEMEKTMYVLDSLILALGYTDYSKRSLDFLKAYTPQSTEKKHLDSETLAIKKAISSLTPVQKIESVALFNNPVLLTYCGELADALSSEMDDYSLTYAQTGLLKNTLVVKPKNYADVFGLRCFFEALIFVGEYQDRSDSDIAAALIKKTSKLFDLSSFSFRLDVQYLKPQDKKDKIASMVGLIESDPRFKSSTSNYQFEIRLLYKKNSMVALIKIPSMDDRFSYRKNTIPASIHPVIAASVVRTLKPYLKEDARVLDPFVGTGTLLYERDMMLPCEELIGVDIKKETVVLAKDNFLNLDVPISFLNANILNSNLNQTFDEIICNMPFGRRVANHEKNEKLYIGFVIMLDTLLEAGGYAFLYTNEKALLKQELDSQENLVVLEEIIIEAGGLYPSLFVVRKSDAAV